MSKDIHLVEWTSGKIAQLPCLVISILRYKYFIWRKVTHMDPKPNKMVLVKGLYVSRML